MVYAPYVVVLGIRPTNKAIYPKIKQIQTDSPLEKPHRIVTKIVKILSRNPAYFFYSATPETP